MFAGWRGATSRQQHQQLSNSAPPATSAAGSPTPKISAVPPASPASAIKTMEFARGAASRGPRRAASGAVLASRHAAGRVGTLLSDASGPLASACQRLAVLARLARCPRGRFQAGAHLLVRGRVNLPARIPLPQDVQRRHGLLRRVRGILRVLRRCLTRRPVQPPHERPHGDSREEQPERALQHHPHPHSGVVVERVVHHKGTRFLDAATSRLRP